jgi:heterogeneous nuclear ribonucleoprotein U-like protein 1
MRIGWSTDFSNLQVGEDIMSYGYGGTGKCSVNKKFFDYGQPYSTNDVIGCYLNLDAKSIFYTKNGHYLAEAFKLGPETNVAVFYPHVTVKNMKFQINFGLQYPRFNPVEGYTMIQYVQPNLLVRAIGCPDTRKDSQVIMMIGIPACGKTVWAEKYAKENKHKKFNIIGTNSIMDRMKVMGLTRQRNYSGRWDALIKQATDILTKILKIAETKNRNYILDQTNVYPGAQRRKMKNFHGFHRTAAVLVNTDEVLKYRTEKRQREEGKLVPETAVMEMKANFTIPETGDAFDEVWFIEENEESSKRLVEEFNEQGKAYLYKEQENKRKRSTDSEENQGPPPKDSYHASGHSNKEHSQSGTRPHVHHPQHSHGAHGYGTHHTTGYGVHVSGGYNAHHPRPPFVPAESRPQTRFPTSQMDNLSGEYRHNYPERGAYSMPGQHGMPPAVQDRYMSMSSGYDPSHHQNIMSNHRYYEGSEPYMYARQSMQRYRHPYEHDYDRAELNPDFHSVQETRPGCSSYDSLRPSNGRPEPVENECPAFNERPSNNEELPYSSARSTRGYSSQHQYGRGSRY